jgi:hypothetical protein
VNKAIYTAYHDVYLANLLPLDSGIDSNLENELSGRPKAVDR